VDGTQSSTYLPLMQRAFLEIVYLIVSATLSGEAKHNGSLAAGDVSIVGKDRSTRQFRSWDV